MGTNDDRVGPVPLRTADFDYDLPPELIAQTPLENRAASRLLVLDRATGTVDHATIADLGRWLSPGDLLIANNSRVIPARLRGVRLPGRGTVEVLLLREEEGQWSALARPAKRLRPGMELEFAAKSETSSVARAVIEENLGGGEVRLRFEDDADRHLDDFGDAPLPPYITTRLDDAERYQTIYGTIPGSAAAPTAGLHFTSELMTRLQKQGIGWAEVTLHVGLDTFRPVTEELVSEHQIHREWCEVPQATAEAIANCRLSGGRVVAIGTTAVRTLETLGRRWRDDAPSGWSGFTDEFIVPGHEWKLVDAMLTNFHLPRSTLLMLVSAFAGREIIAGAYAEAIRHRYRFFSFGDAMLIR
jgi:S-adenosylmethionine:tRNA ribosyltransferase-isomerase